MLLFTYPFLFTLLFLYYSDIFLLTLLFIFCPYFYSLFYSSSFSYISSIFFFLPAIFKYSLFSSPSDFFSYLSISSLTFFIVTALLLCALQLKFLFTLEFISTSLFFCKTSWPMLPLHYNEKHYFFLYMRNNFNPFEKVLHHFSRTGTFKNIPCWSHHSAIIPTYTLPIYPFPLPFFAYPFPPVLSWLLLWCLVLISWPAFHPRSVLFFDQLALLLSLIMATACA